MGFDVVWNADPGSIAGVSYSGSRGIAAREEAARADQMALRQLQMEQDAVNREATMQHQVDMQVADHQNRIAIENMKRDASLQNYLEKDSMERAQLKRKRQKWLDQKARIEEAYSGGKGRISSTTYNSLMDDLYTKFKDVADLNIPETVSQDELKAQYRESTVTEDDGTVIAQKEDGSWYTVKKPVPSSSNVELKKQEAVQKQIINVQKQLNDNDNEMRKTQNLVVSEAQNLMESKDPLTKDYYTWDRAMAVVRDRYSPQLQFLEQKGSALAEQLKFMEQDQLQQQAGQAGAAPEGAMPPEAAPGGAAPPEQAVAGPGAQPAAAPQQAAPAAPAPAWAQPGAYKQMAGPMREAARGDMISSALEGDQASVEAVKSNLKPIVDDIKALMEKSSKKGSRSSEGYMRAKAQYEALRKIMEADKRGM